MDYRRALTASGTKVHLSQDAKWQYDPPGQNKRGFWSGTTLCNHALLCPPDLPVNEAGEVEYESDQSARDQRPVDCAHCLSYASREIDQIRRVLSGEW